MHTNFYSINLTYYSGLCPHWESLGLPEPPKFSFYVRNAHQLKEFVEKKKNDCVIKFKCSGLGFFD